LHLTIDKLVYGGDGLARLPADENGRGKAAFLPFVLPGEEVEAKLVEQKTGFARAHVEKILQSSPKRIEPACPYFQKCGGCHYQHTNYEHQLEIKAAILKENLRRIAKLELETELIIHPSPPWNYRNRTRLKIRTQPEFTIGYYKYNSHELLPIEQCPISSPLINQAIKALWQAGTTGQITSEAEEIELFADAEDAQLFVELYCTPNTPETTAIKMTEDLRQALQQMAGIVAFRRAMPPTEPKPIASSGATDLQYKTDHGIYRVSAGAFFQVNRHLINNLAQIATAESTGQTALDLYAGAGLFAAPLAKSFAQVIAVESSQTSQSDLAYNSPANVRTVRATVEQYLQNAPAKLSPDLVVLDPPRSGLGESVVRSLAALRAPRITYVSCDPATLARDLGGLLKAGYRVEQAHLLDLFPQTFHLETVLRLAR
jgi:23S rRNA (uracil1939-C5)-methyltransferase